VSGVSEIMLMPHLDNSRSLRVVVDQEALPGVMFVNLEDGTMVCAPDVQKPVRVEHIDMGFQFVICYFSSQGD